MTSKREQAMMAFFDDVVVVIKISLIITFKGRALFKYIANFTGEVLCGA
jgi:hypothetical protein